VNTKLWVVVLASTFALVIVSAIIVNNLESSGKLSTEVIGAGGVAAFQGFFFALFCMICFAIVPVAIGFFIAGQIKIGNGELLLRQQNMTTPVPQSPANTGSTAIQWPCLIAEVILLVKWLQGHERAVVYGIWGMLAVGFCIAIPAAIKDVLFITSAIKHGH
jgi:hypothetical protein